MILLLIVYAIEVGCGGGRIGVNQNRNENASTMAHGTFLNFSRVDYYGKVSYSRAQCVGYSGA